MARTRMFGRTVVALGSAEFGSRLLLDREHSLSNEHGWSHFLGELFAGGLMLRDFDERRLHRGIKCRSLRTLGWDELDRLEFVDRCFREAIRLQPPVPYILRRTVAACRVGEHALPERTPTTLIVHAVHRDPALWSDPDRFDPDRFAPDRAEDRRHPHAWILSAAGPIRCIGAELARQQAKLFCHHLLRRARVERVRAGATVWRQVPIPMPKDGLPVRLTQHAP